MAQYSALRCVSGIWQNSEKPLISNELGFVITYLLTAALWVLFHVARHTFATMMLTLGADLYTTSKLLGHADVKMTQVYAKIINQKKDDAVNLVNGLFE